MASELVGHARQGTTAKTQSMSTQLKACETRPPLQQGDTGEAVVDLQILLNRNYLDGLAEDGEFGPHTRSSLLHYQRKEGLNPNGLATADTWGALCGGGGVPAATRTGCVQKPRLSQGSKGPAVTDVQELLNEKYNAGLAVDGDFGTYTKNAVTDFQREYKLIVDGIVGNQVWGALCGMGSAGCATKPRLAQGAKGQAVKDFQKPLREKYNANLPVDGDFGPFTMQVVTEFQREYKLIVDGIVGNQVWGAVCVTGSVGCSTKPRLAQGDKGQAVKDFQGPLSRKYNSSLPVDGDFGAYTKQVVTDFQREYKLIVDGIVGNQVWGALCGTGSVGCATKPRLAQGAKGQAVKDFQKPLREKYNATLPVDGDFGPFTMQVVTEFQREYKLIVDGIVGNQVWGALCVMGPVGCVTKPRLAEGATGQAVKDVQQLLNEECNANLAVDGKFETYTKTAVTNFQTHQGLIIDGIVGDQTWGALCRN